MTTAQLSLPIAAPTPARRGPSPEAAALLDLCAGEPPEKAPMMHDHFRRAVALLDSPDRWAARPYLVALFLGTAWERHHAAKVRPGSRDIALSEEAARRYLEAVRIVRALPRLPWAEEPLGQLEDPLATDQGSSVARLVVLAFSTYWPDLWHGLDVEVYRSFCTKPPRYGALLHVGFPDERRSGFSLRARLPLFRNPEQALRLGRRFAALGSALLRAEVP